MTSTVPQPLERYTSALSEHGESQALAPSAPEQYDAALSDALRDITAVARTAEIQNHTHDLLFLSYLSDSGLSAIFHGADIFSS